MARMIDLSKVCLEVFALVIQFRCRTIVILGIMIVSFLSSVEYSDSTTYKMIASLITSAMYYGKSKKSNIWLYMTFLVLKGYVTHQTLERIT